MNTENTASPSIASIVDLAEVAKGMDHDLLHAMYQMQEYYTIDTKEIEGKTSHEVMAAWLEYAGKEMLAVQIHEYEEDAMQELAYEAADAATSVHYIDHTKNCHILIDWADEAREEWGNGAGIQEELQKGETYLYWQALRTLEEAIAEAIETR